MKKKALDELSKFMDICDEDVYASLQNIDDERLYQEEFILLEEEYSNLSTQVKTDLGLDLKINNKHDYANRFVNMRYKASKLKGEK